MQVKVNYTFLISILFYCISALFFFIFYGKLINADTISYLAISEKISSGNFYGAINGYWSPLISWLIVPFLLITKNGLLSFQIVNFSIGIFIVFRFYTILKSYCINLILIHITLIGTALLIGFWSMYNLTADIVFVAVLLQYYYWLLTTSLFKSKWQLVCIGLLLYLAKAYGFYFFIAHSIGYFIYYNYCIKKIKFSFLAKKYAIGLILVSIWVGILCYKYGYVTLSTASVYNKSIITKNGTLLHPCDTLGLLPPMQSFKYTAWEEMYLHTKTEINKSPTNNFNLLMLVKNLKGQFHFYNKTPRYGAYIFLIGIVILGFVDLKKLKQLILPISLYSFFTGGYLLYFINDRYLLFPILVLILLLALIVNEIAEKIGNFKYLLYLLLAYSLTRSFYDENQRLNLRDEKISYTIAKHFTKTPTTNYASYNAYQFASIAYYCNWKNFGGTIGYNEDSLRLQKDLEKYKIEFLLYPNAVLLPQNVSIAYEKLSLPNIDNFTVYQRK